MDCRDSIRLLCLESLTVRALRAMRAERLGVLLFIAFTIHILMTARLRSTYNDCGNYFSSVFSLIMSSAS